MMLKNKTDDTGMISHKNTFVYYPLTFYHLIWCYILAKKLDKGERSIVMDKNLFSDILISNIDNSGFWGEIYVAQKSEEKPPMFQLVQRLFFSKKRCPELFKLSGVNVVFFSAGSWFCNLWINSIAKSSKIIMAEDGIAPFYFKDLTSGWEKQIASSSIYTDTKRWIKSFIKNSLNISNVDELWVSKIDWISPDILSKIAVKPVQMNSNDVQSAFGMISDLFLFSDVSLRQAIDVVYFDHNYGAFLEKEHDFLLHAKLFSRLKGRYILVKLRYSGGLTENPRVKFFLELREKYGFNIVLDESMSNVPWELIYYKNQDVLKKAVLISSHLSTALLTSKIFFDTNHVIYDFHIIFLSHIPEVDLKEFSELVARINRESPLMHIYSPSEFNDVTI